MVSRDAPQEAPHGSHLPNIHIFKNDQSSAREQQRMLRAEALLKARFSPVKFLPLSCRFALRTVVPYSYGYNRCGYSLVDIRPGTQVQTLISPYCQPSYINVHRSRRWYFDIWYSGLKRGSSFFSYFKKTRLRICAQLPPRL